MRAGGFSAAFPANATASPTARLHAYRYRAAVPQRVPAAEEIQHRMSGRFVNEALLCLQGEGAPPPAAAPPVARVALPRLPPVRAGLPHGGALWLGLRLEFAACRQRGLSDSADGTAPLQHCHNARQPPAALASPAMHASGPPSPQMV